MFLPGTLILRPMLAQLQHIRLSHLGHIEHGFGQLGIEGLAASLFPLDLKPAFHGRPHRLDGGGLEQLALSQGTDHGLTTRAGG